MVPIPSDVFFLSLIILDDPPLSSAEYLSRHPAPGPDPSLGRQRSPARRAAGRQRVKAGPGSGGAKVGRGWGWAASLPSIGGGGPAWYWTIQSSREPTPCSAAAWRVQ